MAVDGQYPDGGVYPGGSLLADYAPLRPVDGVRGIVAHQARDVFELWHAWEVASGRERNTPFWAVVWPAARVLAALILDRRVDLSGRRVLELGCGGAVAAIAAIKSGAAGAIANDTDPAALRVASRNADANGVALVLDQSDMITAGVPEAVDTVVIADMFYELQVARRTMTLVERFVERGGNVLIADAGRPFAPCEYGTCIHEEWVRVDGDLEGEAYRTVRVTAVGAGWSAPCVPRIPGGAGSATDDGRPTE